MLQRAITRSSCHSLRSSSPFPMFRSGEGSRMHWAGRGTFSGAGFGSVLLWALCPRSPL